VYKPDKCGTCYWLTQDMETGFWDCDNPKGDYENPDCGCYAERMTKAEYKAGEEY